MMIKEKINNAVKVLKENLYTIVLFCLLLSCIGLIALEITAIGCKYYSGHCKCGCCCTSKVVEEDPGEVAELKHSEIINTYQTMFPEVYTISIPKDEEVDEEDADIKSEEIDEEVIEEEIVEEIVEEVVEEQPTYFDVPLDHELQDYIFELCEKYSVDPAIVVSMIYKESSFRATVMGDNGNSYGLMQIQPRWNQERMDKLGCQNLLDPYQNVTVGIDLIGELVSKGKPIEWVLMSYNGGQSYANKKWAKGEVSEYATTVLEYSETLVRK